MTWEYLFYDKFAGDNKFCNPITQSTTINDLGEDYTVITGDDAIDYFNNTFNTNKEYNIPDMIKKSNLCKVTIYLNTINQPKPINIIYTVVGINLERLEQLITSKKQFPESNFLKNVCKYHLSYTTYNRLAEKMFSSNTKKNAAQTNSEFIKTQVINPVDYTFDGEIEDIPEIKEKLFQYQKCSINWMYNTEKQGTEILYNLNDEVILGNIYYELWSQSFFHISNKKRLQFYGGGLIDEVGLGKTVQMIALSLKNPSECTSYTRYDDNYKLYSRATLILCPSHLCGQWIREIDKMVESEYANVISIMTKVHHDKYTYQDLLDADFVILSYNFLDNKSYTNEWMSKISTKKNFNKTIWSEQEKNTVQTIFKDGGNKLIKNIGDTLDKKNVQFQHINWYRMIIDEFHEVDKSTYSYVTNMLQYFTATYKWGVTATPFATNNNLLDMVNYVTGYKNTDGDKIFENTNIVEHMSTKFYRRNTKASVAQEHTLPPIKEEVVWLKFSSTERMMYNAYIANPNNSKYSVYLRQLCCHPQLANETKMALSNCKSLQEIEKVMVSHYKSDVEQAEIKVAKTAKRIRKIKRKIRKIEKKQKELHAKKHGIKYVDESESDDELDSESNSESDSYEDDVDLNVIVNDTTGTQFQLRGTITLEKLRTKLEELNKKSADETILLDGKKTTLNFFSTVIDRLSKTASKKNQAKYNDEGEMVQVTSSNIMDLVNSDFGTDDDGGEDEEDTCGICMSNIAEDDIGVTKCGHIFCYECLKIVVEKYKKCPMCNKATTMNEIYVLSYERKKKVEDNVCLEKDALINEIGTKLANLIFYLRETNEHTIIFSQWDDLLKKIGRVLEKNKIKNVFCKGNCYQRDKAIREFNEDDKIKIIMLSSESAAAGTNLTKASQVIFIDPIYGNYKYRKDQERQAIGRAHRMGQKNIIKVVRFLIKNSIEEEIYLNNIKEDTEQTIDVTK